MEERRLSSVFPIPRNSVLELERKFSTASTKSIEEGSGIKNGSIKQQQVVEKSFRNKKWPQYYSAISAQVGGFALGATWFWTATALPDMASSGELGNITNSDRSWITSIPQLGALIVCPITGYCMSRFGRRMSMLWSTIPFVGGWVLIGFAPSIQMVYLGRLILGAASGNFAQIVPLFVAECAEVEIRGTLMCMFEIMICLGTIFIYVIGTFFSWRNQAFICGIIPIVGHILLFFVPESPYYLMERDRDEEAGKALCWLRGATSIDQVKEEFLDISDCVRQKTAEVENIGWRALKDASILKPILLCIGLMASFQGSFINVILAAAVEIFQSAGSLDENLSTVILGVTQMVATGIPLFVADKFGRRILILISLALVTISLTILGFFFHFKDHYGDIYVHQFRWVPLASLVSYVVACSIGIVPLTWVIMGEITPPKAKGMATTIVNVWNRIVGFFVLYIFWDMIEFLGKDGTYWTIAGINIIAAVFIISCVPETKGKTLNEIQMHFSTGDKTKL